MGRVVVTMDKFVTGSHTGVVAFSFTTWNCNQFDQYGIDVNPIVECSLCWYLAYSIWPNSSVEIPGHVQRFTGPALPVDGRDCKFSVIGRVPHDVPVGQSHSDLNVLCKNSLKSD